MSAAFHEAALAGDPARMEALLGARVPEAPEPHVARHWMTQNGGAATRARR